MRASLPHGELQSKWKSKRGAHESESESGALGVHDDANVFVSPTYRENIFDRSLAGSHYE